MCRRSSGPPRYFGSCPPGRIFDLRSRHTPICRRSSGPPRYFGSCPPGRILDLRSRHTPTTGTGRTPVSIAAFTPRSCLARGVSDGFDGRSRRPPSSPQFGRPRHLRAMRQTPQIPHGSDTSGRAGTSAVGPAQPVCGYALRSQRRWGHHWLRGAPCMRRDKACSQRL